MDSFHIFFATSDRTKRRKHYVCLIFSQYWVGVETNQCSRHFSKKPILGLFYLETHRKVNATTLELFTTNFKISKRQQPTRFQTLTFGRIWVSKTQDSSPGVIHDFWKIDVIDACLMVHGSRLMAHGQGRPGEAHGSWPDAAPALGTQSRGIPWP